MVVTNNSGPLAAVLTGPGEPITLHNFAKPNVKRGEVLLHTMYSEVCGTDVHIQQGKLAGVPYPIIPGHFAVGTVEETGGDVQSVSGRPIIRGDIVTFLDVHATCHRCWQCQVNKAPTKCPSRKVYGVSHSSNEGLLGGWSEMILLQNDVAITHLPENVSPLRFIAGGCAMPTAVHAVERGKVGLGDIVVVQGAGPVGLCTGIVAYHSGARVLIADKSTVRLEAAHTLGFEVLDLSTSDNAQSLLEYATQGQRADVVIEATGSPSAIQSGISLVRDAGRYVVVGHYSDAGSTTINPHLDINKKHLEILGTWGVEYIHFHKAIGLLARKELTPSGIKIEDAMTTIYPLHEVNKALSDVRERRVVKAVICANSGD
ncbi:zinc-binding dehydrogenase [Gynuella sunshinyii]|uniref:Threonine dehydrogenase and related Zn-dependent dehydrogenase n=1 Tax=Gynuella sunshinyii YC6258 TaxID=1445510 RepID=A0A0C5W5C0_9GAMM|nr:zinc-binding dehydrogenase [Gynuella sunshinyii]AJQ97779.1 threonine dehydrogenase and related Zn-dependent dehydrogenase [Gynuella sunshinyii YC6258]